MFATLLLTGALVATGGAASPRISPVLDAVVGAPVGSAWAHRLRRGPSLSPPRRLCCADYQSDFDGGMLDPPSDVWLHRCATTLAGGMFEERAFLLGDDLEVRLGLVRWSLGTPAMPPRRPDPLAELRDSLASSLAARLGPGRVLAASPAGDWQLEDGIEFLTRDGIVRLHRVDQGTGRDSLVLEYRASQLETEQREFWSPAGGASDDFGMSRTRERRREAARALGPDEAGLRRAVDVDRPSIEALPDVRQAFVAAAKSHNPETRDLVAWAGHLWLDCVRANADSASLRRIEAALAPFGVRIERAYDELWPGYHASLVVPLLARSGRSPWADRALAERFEAAWDSAGTGDYNLDAYLFIIPRGERFLARHPRSIAWREVALLVAQSHETAWSISRSKEYGDVEELGDTPADPVSAAAHRQRALALYRVLVRAPLPEGGSHWWVRAWGNDANAPARLRDLRRRIRRLELNIDTGGREHRYTNC